ncbi:MAG: putative metal-binding motif-containing protein [Myxococcaceae bacterium]|jgi:hypothetical protein|nr:putative metal-binding motif-containing protein [Myxococcaceae bacterium]
MRALWCIAVASLSACQCGGRVVGSSSSLSIEPGAVDFGVVQPASVEARELVAQVRGRASLTLTAVSIEARDGRFTTTLRPRVLTPGDEHRFVVEYAAPTGGAADEGVLIVEAGGEVVRVPLRAAVPAACVPRTSCLVLESESPECGTAPDGCGGVVGCGACAPTQQCMNQRCVASPVDAGAPPDAGALSDAGRPTDAGVTPDAGACVPTTCAARGASCGALPDGCGGTLACGSCGGGATCTQHQCVCPGGAVEVCGDGVDNDCDGNADCVDADCAAMPVCAQPACANAAPEVQVTAAPANSNGSAIVSVGNGSWLLVAHESDGNLSLRYTAYRLDHQLQVVGAPQPMPNMFAAHKPFAAWTGTALGLAWSDARSPTNANDVYFGRLSSSGQPLGLETGVSTQPGLAFPASVGWNPTAGEFGVLWADDRTAGPGNDRALYFRRLTAHGQLAGAEVSLSAAPTGLTTDFNDITWGGTTWGIVATQLRNAAPFMLFNRLSSTGAPELADVQLNVSGRGAYQPRIASGAAHYGVVFEEHRPGASGQSEVVFVRASKTGPANPVRTQLTTSGTASLPAVVWTGAQWLVFFSDRRTGLPRIWLTRLDAVGARLGQDELMSCAPVGASFPQAAFDGSAVALTWVSTVGTQPQAFVKRFTP